MADRIARSVLELTTDNSGLNKGIDDAVRKVVGLGDSGKEALGRFTAGAGNAELGLGSLSRGLTAAAGLIGVTFTAGAVVSFAGKIFDTASQIHDMSAALGWSAEALQRNKYAAEQSGGSFEALQKAASKLNQNLGEGGKSTVAALTATGLKFDEIRGMKPEDAFSAVADAVGKIPDPMTRAQVAQDLFGKGALELLPGMIEGYKQLGAGATVMSNETVARLEAAQDSWDHLWNSVVMHSGEVVGAFMSIFDYSSRLEKAITETAKKNGTAYEEEAAKVHALSRAKQDAYLDESEQRKSQSESLAKYQTQYASAFTVSEAATRTLKEAQEKAAEAAKKHADQVDTVAKRYSKQGLSEALDEATEKLRAIEKQGGFTTEGIRTFGKELDDLRKNGGQLTPQMVGVWTQFRTMELTALAASGGTKAFAKTLKDSGARPRSASRRWRPSIRSSTRGLATPRTSAMPWPGSGRR